MINLYTSLYNSPDRVKLLEMYYVLTKNLSNPIIDKVCIFNENYELLPIHDKIHVVGNSRPTYNNFFAAINEFTPNEINIIANSDIHFDSTLQLIENIGADDCYALSRYEEGVLIQNSFGSQDAWIFNKTIKNINANFYTGTPGCDNSIAYHIKMAGYNISNPSLDVMIHHIHKSSRNWTMGSPNTIPPPYLYVQSNSL